MSIIRVQITFSFVQNNLPYQAYEAEEYKCESAKVIATIMATMNMGIN
jgi:hypothetical protein